MRFLSDVTVELVRHSAADSDVVWAARVSTAGEQSLEAAGQDAERSRGLINFLMRDRHGSPFEHNSMTFFVNAPILVFREFHRHRVGWCLAGDTEITFEDAGGRTSHQSIAEVHRLWHTEGGAPGAAGDGHVRTYDETTLLAGRARVLEVMESGVKPLIRLTTATGRSLRCSADHAILTPGGWRKAGELGPGDPVMSGDTAGNPADDTVTNPAGGTASPDPIVSVVADGEEMTYDLSVQGPWHNFLAGGIVVHNSYNEESGRYRELAPVFYVPGRERALVQEGKPGHYRFTEGDDDQYKLVTEAMEQSYRRSYEAYQEMLAAGVAREVARSVLPVGLFSSMYATCNARSLMHFLSLRTKDERATVPSFPQREIEMVAEKMEAIWAGLMPITHAAFNATGRVAP